MFQFVYRETHHFQMSGGFTKFCCLPNPVLKATMTGCRDEHLLVGLTGPEYLKAETQVLLLFLNKKNVTDAKPQNIPMPTALTKKWVDMGPYIYS